MWQFLDIMGDALRIATFLPRDAHQRRQRPKADWPELPARLREPPGGIPHRGR